MAEQLKILEVAKVNLVGHALPDGLGGIGMGERHAVGAEEDVVCVGEVLHKRQPHFVEAEARMVVFEIAHFNQLGQRVGRRPSLNDGWQHPH